MRGAIIVAAVSGVMLGATPLLSWAGSLERTIQVNPGGTLHIALDRGAIHVDSHDDQDVRIEARASGWPWDIDFQITREGDDVRLSGRTQTEAGLTAHLAAWALWPFSYVQVEVHAWVPRRYSVEMRTSGGALEVTNVEGTVVADTAGGRIDVADVVGQVRARSGGGAVAVVRVAGSVEARTGGGSIDVREVSGPAIASSGGGAVFASFTGSPAGRVETGGGSIEVRFPPGSGAELDAQTGGGRIDVSHPIVMHAGTGRFHVAGTIGGGGAVLSLRTGGGEIRVGPL